MIRVAIADDHGLVRAGIRLIVEAQDDLTVSIEATTGRELIHAVARSSTDVVLMDVRMPDMDGLEATRRLVSSGGPRVIVLTTFEMDEYVYEALKAGASGYLLKSTPPKVLVQAIRDAAAGAEVLSPAITRRLVESYVRRPDPADRAKRLHDLSEREIDVLRMLARGRSNVEIAGDLFISEATVKTHLTRILSKMGARDRLQAVIAAYEMGFVEPGGAAE